MTAAERMNERVARINEVELNAPGLGADIHAELVAIRQLLAFWKDVRQRFTQTLVLPDDSLHESTEAQEPVEQDRVTVGPGTQGDVPDLPGGDGLRGQLDLIDAHESSPSSDVDTRSVGDGPLPGVEEAPGSAGHAGGAR